jgi:hypothetical protein
MNDYFGALLRSSGIAVGSNNISKSYSETPIPADYGISEINEQVNVTPNDEGGSINTSISSTENLSVQSPSKVPDEGFSPAGIEGISMPSAIESETLDIKSPLIKVHADSSLGNTTRVEKLAGDDALLHQIAPNHSSNQESPPSGPALVQAALRWIVAGENQTQVAPKEAMKHESRTGEQDAEVDYSSIALDESPVSKPVDQERFEAVLSPLSVQSVRAQPIDFQATMRDPVRPSEAPYSGFEKEEVVEISIGSIHLRVDAPPPLAAATRTPPPVNKATTEWRPRSSLSRRALRRI